MADGTAPLQMESEMIAQRVAVKRKHHPHYPVAELEAAVRIHVHNLRLLDGMASGAGGGSYFFRVGDVEYLAYRQRQRRSQFELFATVYHLPAGIIDLNESAPPNKEILGYRIDYPQIAERLRSFGTGCSHHLRAFRERFWPARQRRILLWGFINNLGHHLWNEHGGIDLLIADGALGKVDEVILGPFDFFGYGEFLARHFPVRRSGPAEPPIESAQLLLRSADVVFSEATRHRVLAWAALQGKDGSSMEKWLASTQRRPVVCIQIRRHARRWLEEVRGVGEIIKAIAERWPEARFIVDGMSATDGQPGSADDLVQTELAEGRTIQQSLPHGTAVYCAIGENLNTKIRAFSGVDIFIAPIGSGNTISSWLLRKPTIVYGPTAHYSFCQSQERCIPEGGGTGIFIPEAHIADASGQDYHLDWKIVADTARLHLEKIAEDRGFNI